MSSQVKVKNIAQVRVSTDHLDPVGGSARTVKFAKITLGAAATTAIVAAVTGKKIRVLKVFIQGAVNTFSITFKSGTTAISGVIPMSATAGTSFKDSSEFGLFETAAGAALNITTANIGGAGTGFGYLTYVEV